MINYIIQVVLFYLLFIFIYDVLLRKETFFNWNRAYLLLTPLLSFILPFIKINAFTKMSQTGFVEYLPAVILNPQERLQSMAPPTFTSYFLYILILGSVFMFGLFVYKLVALFILRNKGHVEKHASHSLVIIDKKGIVFSFFKSIFIDKTFINQSHQHIIKHELVHIKQGHSYDLILFEILKIINWFNPAVYIFQNRITELHEFIADAKTIESKNKSDFFNRLLNTTFKVAQVDFINQFYKHSLLKKRIMMTNKNKSKQVLKLKYLLLVPVLGSMIFYVSCNSTRNSISKDATSLKKSIAKKDSLSKKDMKEIFEVTQQAVKKIKKNKTKNFETLEVEAIDYVPFAEIEQVPIYPGCEDAQNQKSCFSGKLITLISQKFNVKLPENLGLTPGNKRIFVLFTIDKTGKVVNIRARAPHKKLEEEAIRVINLIPKLKPGFDKGKAVAVKYSLPIVFNVPK
jgi:bla regulator protein blaR1